MSFNKNSFIILYIKSVQNIKEKSIRFLKLLYVFKREEQYAKPDRGVRIAPKSSKVSGRSWVAKYPASTASSLSLYFNFLDKVKCFFSLLHCIKDVEDLVAPSGDECDVVTDKPYRKVPPEHMD